MPSRSRAPIIAIALVAAGAIACGPKRVPYDPFKVPREQFIPGLKVVALAPMEAPNDLENADAVKARFLATIEARLRDAGIAVIPPAEVGPILAATAEWRGGFFDPKTGQLDTAKLAGAREEALANVAAKFGRADAILVSDIRVVRAALVHDTAQWDGTSESVSTSAWKIVLGVSHSGWVRALSLVVRLTGSKGNNLYVGSGGIRVLSKIGVGGSSVPVPQGDLFADEERNAKAVSLALDALVGAARQGTAAAAPASERVPAVAPAAPPPAAPAATPASPSR